MGGLQKYATFFCFCILISICNTDQQQLTDLEIFRKHCPEIQTCTNRSLDVEPLETSACCSPCFCDEYCWDRGNCCPDVQHPYSEPTIDCKFTRSEVHGYLVIDTCKNDTLSFSYIICKTEKDPRLFKDAVHVSDMDNQLVYRNQHCAMCNGVHEFIPWTMSTIKNIDPLLADKCEHNKEEMLGDIEKLYKCGIISVKPNLEIYFKAACLERTTVIGCSKDRPEYAENIRLYARLCEKYKLPFFYGGSTYGNVFCLLCLKETADLSGYESGCSTESILNAQGVRNGKDTAIPFSQIFNLRDHTDEMTGVCRNTQLYDEYKNKCLDLACGFSYTVDNGACVRNMIESSYYIFRLRIEFTSEAPTDFKNGTGDEEIAERYIATGKRLLESLSPCTFVNDKAWKYTEEEHMKKFLWQTEVYTTAGCQDDDIAFVTKKVRSGEIFVRVDILSDETNYALTILLYDNIEQIYRPRVSLTLSESIQVSFDAKPIFVSAVTFCNGVVLSETVFERLKFDIIWNLGDKDYFISKLVHNTAFVTSSFVTCRSVFEELTGELVAYERSHNTGTLSGYISLACTIISIICAGATFVINLIFDRAYNLPKYILHMVCVNLVLAQSVFQFGIGTRAPRLLCITIGAVIHYAWLAHALAMSAFVLGVVIKLRSGVSNSSLSNSRVIYHVLYIYGTPVVFVILNVIITRITSDGDKTGYGREGTNQLCYISSALSRIVFFVVPIFAIVGLNTSAYVYFIWFMVKAWLNSEALGTQRLYIQAYARLSSVTGFTWLFGLMSELVPSEVFEYLFIITNCGQGIIMFIAFGRLRNVYLSIKTRRIMATPSVVDTN